MVGACRTNGGEEEFIIILVGKPEGERPVGGYKFRWADNIEVYRREMGWNVMEWTDLAQDRNQLRVLKKVSCP
jgi:hypothetical protein